jgi:hypothetical protein
VFTFDTVSGLCMRNMPVDDPPNEGKQMTRTVNTLGEDDGRHVGDARRNLIHHLV